MGIAHPTQLFIKLQTARLKKCVTAKRTSTRKRFPLTLTLSRQGRGNTFVKHYARFYLTNPMLVWYIFFVISLVTIHLKIIGLNMNRFSLFAFSIMLLIIISADPAFCAQRVFKVLNVNNVVRLDNKKETEYRDCYTSFGTENGAKVGGMLQVHRRMKERSEVASVTDKKVSIPIGMMRIISVEEDSSVARLIVTEDREKNPLVEYDTVMIGDIVTPVKEKAVEPETISLPNAILFDFDKYDLRETATKTLNDIGSRLVKIGYEAVIIDGHTDSIGSDKYNVQLSKRRANSVFDYLSKKFALSKNLFTVKGYGEGSPTSSNKTVRGRQENRRATITLIK